MVATPLKMAAIALVAGLGAASVASAQTMSANSASMNAGYGRAPGEENRLVDFGGRDANGNRLIVDGVIQTGEDQSVFARAGGGGVSGSMSGVGALGGSSTAIGNNLVVVTQGSWNTVIVNSSQTNNGNVTAGSSTSGGVGGN
jgi:holdfast attachment protein HfaA